MDIERIRQEFPVTREYIYFDHAAVSPIPGRAVRPIQGFLDDLQKNGLVNYLEWFGYIEETRSMFAQLIKAKREEIAFVKNTTEGLCIVANGIDWKRGDNKERRKLK